MKLTIFKTQLPERAATNRPTPPASQDDFTRKLATLRAATGRPERFISLCACAVHDKPFTAVYERIDPGRPFILTGIYKDGAGDATTSEGSARPRSLPASEVDHTGWLCPHCGDGQYIACGNCKAMVCGGRTRRYPGTAEIFTCRVSCGARGTLIDAATVEGVEPARKSVSSKPISERLPAPGADALRLAAPMPPRLK
jgi:hypothetical protein